MPLAKNRLIPLFDMNMAAATKNPDPKISRAYKSS